MSETDPAAISDPYEISPRASSVAASEETFPKMAAGPSPAEIDAIAWSAVDESVQRKHRKGARELNGFLRDTAHAFLTKKNDERTNIIDQGDRLTYNLNREYVSRLFGYLEQCRTEGSTAHFSERQGIPSAPRSGFMLDFDIKTTMKKPVLSDRHYYRLTGALLAALSREVDFAAQMPPSAGGKMPLEMKIHVFFIIKPAAVLIDGTGNAGDPGSSTTSYYKYGLHALVPGIKMGRAYKKWFLRQFKSDPAVTSTLQELGVIGDPCDVLDQNSASVPVLFFGSCKRGGTPYVLGAALEVTLDIADAVGYSAPPVIKKLTPADLAPYNLVAELSLMSEAEYEDERPPLVRMMEFECRPEIALKAQDWGERTQGDVTPGEELLLAEHSLSTLTLHNAEARHLHALLGLLSEEYYTDRGKWRDVIFALANTNDQYKPLAIWFSHKCPRKWADGGLDALDTLWDDAVARRGHCERPITMASIQHWARVSDPARYGETMERSYFAMLTAYVYEFGGNLQHAMIAKVLHAMLGAKFCVDVTTGARGALSYCWFEFVLPGQSMQPGELWKWRKEVEPDDVHVYMSDKLSKVFDQISEHLEERRSAATEEAQAKYYVTLAKTFAKSKLNLYNDTFKNGVIKQANYIFRRRGFVKQLDTMPDLFGVLNGVLKLGPKITLIDHFHEYPVSQSSTIAYVPFDPTNPWMKLVLGAVADIFPEPDARDWILFHACQGLSGAPKEGLFLLLEGGGQNGKTSFLRWVAKALGPAADKFNIQLMSDAREDASKPNSSLMALKRVNYAYCEETKQGQVLNDARMKELVTAGEVSGRDLQTKQETFTMRCNFVAASQFSFIVNSTDHGTWRRLVFYANKTKFRANPDPNNPFEKKDNAKFGLQYASDPQFLSAMLSLLCHYYERLQNEYGGELKKVRSPTIERETAKFRISQDALHRWISESIVLSPDNETEYPLGVLGGHYTEWYGTHIDRKRHVASEIIKEIEASVLGKKLCMAPNRTLVLRGCRVLLADEMALRPGEEMLTTAEMRGNHTNAEWARACAEADNIAAAADSARRADGRPWWEARVSPVAAAAIKPDTVDDSDLAEFGNDDEAVMRADRYRGDSDTTSMISDADIEELIEKGFMSTKAAPLGPRPTFSLDDLADD
jgi:phage/plasmid-associated DNA primase